MSLIKVYIPAKVAAADAGNFKVGDKVLRKGYPAPSPRDYYRVIEVHPNGSVMLDDGFNGYYSPNLIIRATDAAADDTEGACDDKMKEYEEAYRKDSPEMRARKMRTAKALGDKRSLEMYERVDKELGRVTHDAATDADDKIHYELKGLVKTLRAKGLQQDEISRKLTTYCREHGIPLSYLNRSIFDGCEGAAQDADAQDYDDEFKEFFAPEKKLKYKVGQKVEITSNRLGAKGVVGKIERIEKWSPAPYVVRTEGHIVGYMENEIKTV